MLGWVSWCNLDLLLACGSLRVSLSVYKSSLFKKKKGPHIGKLTFSYPPQLPLLHWSKSCERISHYKFLFPPWEEPCISTPHMILKSPQPWKIISLFLFHKKNVHWSLNIHVSWIDPSYRMTSHPKLSTADEGHFNWSPFLFRIFSHANLRKFKFSRGH